MLKEQAHRNTITCLVSAITSHCTVAEFQENRRSFVKSKMQCRDVPCIDPAQPLSFLT